MDFSPDNGGLYCPGSSVRGIICSVASDCTGFGKKEFADRLCTSFRNDPAQPDPQLSGDSFDRKKKFFWIFELCYSLLTIFKIPICHVKFGAIWPALI